MPKLLVEIYSSRAGYSKQGLGWPLFFCFEKYQNLFVSMVVNAG